MNQEYLAFTYGFLPFSEPQRQEPGSIAIVCTSVGTSRSLCSCHFAMMLATFCENNPI